MFKFFLVKLAFKRANHVWFIYRWCRAHVWSFNAKESGSVVIRRWVGTRRIGCDGATVDSSSDRRCRPGSRLAIDSSAGAAKKSLNEHKARWQGPGSPPRDVGGVRARLAYERERLHATTARAMSGARPRSAPLLLALAAAFLPQANHVAYVFMSTSKLFSCRSSLTSKFSAISSISWNDRKSQSGSKTECIRFEIYIMKSVGCFK